MQGLSLPSIASFILLFWCVWSFELLQWISISFSHFKLTDFLQLFKVTGKCGSVRVRLIPAPRGTGIVSAPVPKKLLQMAGIEDCYTSARGQTATLGNFGNWINFVHKGPNHSKLALNLPTMPTPGTEFTDCCEEQVSWLGQKNCSHCEER